MSDKKIAENRKFLFSKACSRYLKDHRSKKLMLVDNNYIIS